MVKLLRLVSFLEGLSFLVLVGIAMPLKKIQIQSTLFNSICWHGSWCIVCQFYCVAFGGIPG